MSDHPLPEEKAKDRTSDAGGTEEAGQSLRRDVVETDSTLLWVLRWGMLPGLIPMIQNLRAAAGDPARGTGIPLLILITYSALLPIVWTSEWQWSIAEDGEGVDCSLITGLASFAWRRYPRDFIRCVAVTGRLRLHGERTSPRNNDSPMSWTLRWRYFPVLVDRSGRQHPLIDRSGEAATARGNDRVHEVNRRARDKADRLGCPFTPGRNKSQLVTRRLLGFGAACEPHQERIGNALEHLPNFLLVAIPALFLLYIVTK